MLFLLYWLANALLTSAQLTSDVYEVPLGYPALPLNNMDLSVAKDLRRGAQNDALQRTQSPRPAGKRAHAALPAACFAHHCSHAERHPSYVEAAEQRADMLTKGLGPAAHQSQLARMLVCNDTQEETKAPAVA